MKIPLKWSIVEAKIADEDLDIELETSCMWMTQEKVKPDMQYFWKWTEALMAFRKRVKRAIEMKLHLEGEDLLSTVLEFLFE